MAPFCQRKPRQLAKPAVQEIPTTCRQLLIPRAWLSASPGSVPRSRMPSRLVHKNACALNAPPSAAETYLRGRADGIQEGRYQDVRVERRVGPRAAPSKVVSLRFAHGDLL